MLVGIVNDRRENAKAIKSLVQALDGVDVAWTSTTAREAMAQVEKNPPDLLLVEPDLSTGGAVDMIRKVTEKGGCAVLVVADRVEGNERLVFEAMAAGALDAAPAPGPGHSGDPFLAKMSTMLKLLGGKKPTQIRPVPVGPAPAQNGPLPRLVAVGCSTGGPKALGTILPGLPAGFPAAVAIIQHVDRQFSEGLAEWLNSQCALPVRVAREGDKLKAGEIVVAGQGEHLVLSSDRTLHYTANPMNNPFKPSVDVFFSSLATLPFRSSMALVLTGMGRDGAEGLKLLRDKGWHTVAQDEATSAVYGMPRAAVGLHAARSILPLNSIAKEILDFISVTH